MCERNGIGEKQLHKSLKYLLDHKWIEFVGLTPSKTRPIKTYKILDIWKLNNDFYANKKIPSESSISLDTPSEEKDTLPKKDKIPAESRGIRISNIKEKPIKKNIPKKPYSSLSDITKDDLEQIAIQYNVSFGFVRLQLEKLNNYCESKGKTYKNYKSALRNFVLGDMEEQIKRRQNDTKSGVDARGF
jgi:hypothetical protein